MDKPRLIATRDGGRGHFDATGLKGHDSIAENPQPMCQAGAAATHRFREAPEGILVCALCLQAWRAYCRRMEIMASLDAVKPGDTFRRYADSPIHAAIDGYGLDSRPAVVFACSGRPVRPMNLPNVPTECNPAPEPTCSGCWRALHPPAPAPPLKQLELRT